MSRWAFREHERAGGLRRATRGLERHRDRDGAAERETTALGAAALAGVAVGRWSETELAAFRRAPVRCEPQRSAAEVEPLVAGWHDAVRRTMLGL